MDRPQFVYSVYIAATPEKVWQALTDGDFTLHYWRASRIESDWRVGSPVRLTMNGHEVWDGEVLEYDPPRTLSYTFLGPWMQQETHSRVRMQLEHVGAVVKLTVTHDRLTETGLNALRGWPIILCSLKSYLETGKALEFQNYF